MYPNPSRSLVIPHNSCPEEYVVFLDEGHGFVKNENETKGYRGILDFLEEYLKGSRACESKVGRSGARERMRERKKCVDIFVSLSYI